MKTLDEVIKAMEKRLGVGDEDAIENCLDTDALHYLKEYKGLSKMWNDKLDKEQENHPLSKEELIQLNGKPVWIEPIKNWAIVTLINDENGTLITDPYWV